jgi:hypothetical protein
VLGAIDFTTIEVWTKSGLVTFYLLFVMEVATRRVLLAGCTWSSAEYLAPTAPPCLEIHSQVLGLGTAWPWSLRTGNGKIGHAPFLSAKRMARQWDVLRD